MTNGIGAILGGELAGRTVSYFTVNNRVGGQVFGFLSLLCNYDCFFCLNTSMIPTDDLNH
jgi:hypothetical protein